MYLPITLTMAAAAALINIWLAIRIGRVRQSEKISVGDGGSERLTRRMRAQSNFVEFTPFILILIAAIELHTGGTQWLWIVGVVYMLGRIGHGFGMDGGKLGIGRMIGTIISMAVTLGLAGYAIYAASVPAA